MILAITIVLFFINLMICCELMSIHEDLVTIMEYNKELEIQQSEELVVPPTEQFKAWMDYKKITCKTSKQWVIQQLANTDDNGFRRIGDYYICAMGTQYGSVGDCFCVVLDSGLKIHVIKGDEKQNIHTINGEGYQGVDGSVLEFIVDSDKIHPEVKTKGDCSVLGFNGAVSEVIPVSSIIQWD